ncbi:MAG: dephospho-CoA kinase [Pirellulales bacterium]|nr:dephospho-CoA kinase [Pirellulales bacterium]
MRILGVLGGVASGKSLVARRLEAMGAGLLEADRTGHEVLREPNILEAVRERWGDGVMGPDGQVDRARLAKVVFGRTAGAARERKYLQQLTHPEIKRRLEQQAEVMAAQGKKVAVLDAPLLLEAGWDTFCDTLIFVDTPRRLRWERARARGWSEEDFSAREEAQKSLDSKRWRADVVVDNSGSPETTQAQLEHLWPSLVG